MKQWHGILLLSAALVVSGCSNVSGDIPRQTSVVPSGNLRLFPHYSIAFADLVQVGALVGSVYLISDPTAPGWDITETRLPDNRVLYDMKMQYFRLGGDGEARYVVVRRAEALAREGGYAGYQINRYEEAIDSRILLPRRTAFAEIQLVAAR